MNRILYIIWLHEINKRFSFSGRRVKRASARVTLMLFTRNRWPQYESDLALSPSCTHPRSILSRWATHGFHQALWRHRRWVFIIILFYYFLNCISNQIQRYFDALPEDKVPKIGSTGERHRDKQLAYQLPKQDLALNYCKHIEPQNQASYEDFVAARNEIALDIGEF